MSNFLKNFSLKKTFLSKLMVFSFLGLLIFGLFLPTQAQAGILGTLGAGLGAGAQWIAQAILGIALQTTLLIAEGLLAIGIALLSGVIGFTLGGSLSLTSPSPGPTGNPIIHIGWTLVRDFVNIGFILGLVYIGLATALRIAGFELKKVFPWFLIMALLINFTPVICGVVVDAANIVTKFFLGAMANWSLFGEVFSLHKAALGDLFTTISWVPLAKFVLLIAFGFTAGFVLILFALLLLLRFVLIPLLVIFSPLAFLAYIFPRTRGYFTQWWNQLLQWSFVGAIGGFFLYLSRLALREQAMFNFAIPTEDPALGTFMEQIAPYFMAVVFLMVGLFITLQTSAMGANVVTGAAKSVGKKGVAEGKRAGRWMGRRSWQMAKEVTREPRKRIGETLRKIKLGGEAKELKEKAHGVKQAGRWTTGWALRPLGRVLERGVAEETEREIKEAEEKAKGKTAETLAASMEMGGVSEGIGALREAIRSKELRKIRDRGLVKGEKLKRLAWATIRERPELFEDIRDALPEVAGEIGEEMEGEIERLKRMGRYKAVGRLGVAMKRAGIHMTPEERKIYGTLTEKIRATAKPSKIELWSNKEMQEALRSPIFRRYMTPGQLSQMAKTFERDFFDAWNKVAPSQKWLAKWNRPLERYIARSPAGAFGTPFGKEEPSTTVPPTRPPVTPTAGETRLEREKKRRRRREIGP